jgi:hypothetical protein
MKRLLSLLVAWALILAAPGSFAQVSTDAGKTGIARAAHLLCSSAVAVSVTGTTSETALATCTIPAGAMGLNGGLQVHTTWTVTNSVNDKNTRIRLGGIAGTQFYNNTHTTVATVHDFRRIRNRGGASSQVAGIGAASGSFGSSATAITTGSVDTAVSQDLILSCQLELSSESCTLESYEAWLLP